MIYPPFRKFKDAPSPPRPKPTKSWLCACWRDQILGGHFLPLCCLHHKRMFLGLQFVSGFVSRSPKLGWACQTTNYTFVIKIFWFIANVPNGLVFSFRRGQGERDFLFFFLIFSMCSHQVPKLSKCSQMHFPHNVPNLHLGFIPYGLPEVQLPCI